MPDNASALVLREDRDGYTVLTLNRPDKLNALTVAMFIELRTHHRSCRRRRRPMRRTARGGSQRLPRRVGIATAKRLWFTADMIDAQEAVRIGLAEYAVPDAEFEAEIDAVATRIASNSAFTHGAIKQLLEVTDGQHLDAGLQWEWQESAGRGPDMQERIASFTSKKG